jgi:TM2 domain-containing membrane protein YozV
MPDEFDPSQDLSQEEKETFLRDFNARRKNPKTGFLLALSLGAFGAHHFYMRRFGLGTLYLLLSWTFMPLIFACLEVFLIKKEIRLYNHKLALDIATHVKSLRNPEVSERAL